MARVPLEVTVAARDRLSPHLLQVSFTGDALRDFPTGFEGGYTKLLLAPAEEGGRPLMRSYTVRRFDADARELDIWMVSHGDAGPAARWANRAEVGQTATITPPGPCRKPTPEADWFVLAGDLSALPAISVNLETLPLHAQGHVVLEGIDEGDQLDLPRPPGMELTWVTNPHPEVANPLLADTVKALPWREGRASVWVAGEFGSARALRQYFRHEREVHRDDLYVSCYWKIGATDEGMKQAKRADTEAW